MNNSLKKKKKKKKCTHIVHDVVIFFFFKLNLINFSGWTIYLELGGLFWRNVHYSVPGFL